MYQLFFDDGINPPTVIETKLNEADALWWSDRLRELQSKFAVNIIHETTNWLTERLPEMVGARTERPGAEYGAEV